MARPRHSKKAVEAVVRYAESLGWRVKLGSGHNWAQLLCPYGHQACRHGVYSTPRNPENHAQALRRKIDRCPGLPDARPVLIREEEE